MKSFFYDLWLFIKYAIGLLCVVGIVGCSMPVKIIYPDTLSAPAFNCKSKNPIVKAFVLCGYNEKDISAQLKDYGKSDFEGFWVYFKNNAPGTIGADWFLNDLYKKVKTNYEYFKNEK
jgi:hypothetical protein